MSDAEGEGMLLQLCHSHPLPFLPAAAPPPARAASRRAGLAPRCLVSGGINPTLETEEGSCPAPPKGSFPFHPQHQPLAINQFQAYPRSGKRQEGRWRSLKRPNMKGERRK